MVTLPSPPPFSPPPLRVQAHSFWFGHTLNCSFSPTFLFFHLYFHLLPQGLSFCTLPPPTPFPPVFDKLALVSFPSLRLLFFPTLLGPFYPTSVPHFSLYSDVRARPPLHSPMFIFPNHSYYPFGIPWLLCAPFLD